MIYNLKQLNKELIKETQQLSEKFIGIKGKLKKDGKKYYIYGYNLQIMLDCRKINERTSEISKAMTISLDLSMI